MGEEVEKHGDPLSVACLVISMIVKAESVQGRVALLGKVMLKKSSIGPLEGCVCVRWKEKPLFF